MRLAAVAIFDDCRFHFLTVDTNSLHLVVMNQHWAEPHEDLQHSCLRMNNYPTLLSAWWGERQGGSSNSLFFQHLAFLLSSSFFHLMFWIDLATDYDGRQLPPHSKTHPPTICPLRQILTPFFPTIKEVETILFNIFHGESLSPAVDGFAYLNYSSSSGAIRRNFQKAIC